MLTVLLSLQKINRTPSDEECFFDLLSKFQSNRMDDQRCPLEECPSEAAEAAATPVPALEERIRKHGGVDKLPWLRVVLLPWHGWLCGVAVRWTGWALAGGEDAAGCSEREHSGKSSGFCTAVGCCDDRCCVRMEKGSRMDKQEEALGAQAASFACRKNTDKWRKPSDK